MARNPAVLVSLISDWDGKDLDRAIKELQKAQQATDGVGKKLGEFGQKMDGIGKNISKVGGALTKSVTLPLVGVGAAATAMAVEFDSSMAKITGLVGIASDEVDGMRKRVLELSGETAKSPKELADALFVITSAGLRGQDALGALESAAKAGAAGLGETTDIARALAGAMNAYGPSVVDAERATDMIVATARAGNFETSQFAASIGEILPFAKMAQVSLEDMGGAIALITRTNGDAAKATTQVKSLFEKMVVPTEEMKKVLGDVGLSAADMRRAISEDGLPAALTMLDEKLGGNREQLGKLLGSSEAAAAAFQILDADAQTITDTFGAVNDAAGITDEAFDVVADTTGFKMQQAFTSLKSSLIEFGDIIAPLVAKVAGFIKGFADSIANLDDGTKKFIVIAGGIAAAVGPLLLIIGKVIIGIGSLATTLSGVTAVGVILAIKVIAIVAAIAAVVIAFKMMYDRSEALRDAVGRFIDMIKNAAKMLIGDLFDAFKSVIGTTGDAKSMFSDIARVVGDVLAKAIDILIGYWTILVNGVRVVIKVIEVVLKVFRMVATLIRGAFIMALDFLMNRLGPVSTALRALSNGIKSAFETAVRIVRGAIDSAAGFLESFINGAIGMVNTMIRAYNSLAGLIPGVSKITEVAEFQFKSMSSAAEEVAETTYNAASAMGNASAEALRLERNNGRLIDSLGNTGDETEDLGFDLDELLGLLGNTPDGAGKAAKAVDKFGEALKTAKDKVAEYRKGLKEDLDAARKDFQDFAADVSKAIIGSVNLGGAYEGAADRVKAIADAEKELADARAAAGAEGAGDQAAARVLAAEEALARAKASGEQLGLTFMEALNAQAEKAREYGAKVQQLLQMDLDPNSPLMQLVLSSSHETGIGIMDELIAGGVDTIKAAEELLGSVQTEADTIGVEAATHFRGAGVASAEATILGFDQMFGPGGKGRKQLMRIMDNLAKKAKRGVEIEVLVTRRTNEVIERIVSEIKAPGLGVEGAGARGAIVRRPTVALIGEAGPEALLPLDRTRGNSPVSDLNGGGITINVTAGMGTDGAEVGRQIVDAIKAYERRNGAVYATA